MLTQPWVKNFNEKYVQSWGKRGLLTKACFQMFQFLAYSSPCRNRKKDTFLQPSRDVFAQPRTSSLPLSLPPSLTSLSRQTVDFRCQRESQKTGWTCGRRRRRPNWSDGRFSISDIINLNALTPLRHRRQRLCEPWFADSATRIRFGKEIPSRK